MIIIPEIETVVILVPRTGTGALRRAISATYPGSMLIYRHMEADGVPLGYDRWRRVGVVRNPLDRLWSLYHFLRTFGDTEHQRRHDAAYIGKMRCQAEGYFDDWLIHNEIVFTAPYDSAYRGRFFPHYSVRHALPENRKSQFLYLRPDLGTEVFLYDQVADLHRELGVIPERFNGSNAAQPPRLCDLSIEAGLYLRSAFAWDYVKCEELARLAKCQQSSPPRTRAQEGKTDARP